jgi:hypothetical protein
VTGKEIFHLEWPRMKHEENSNRGDREAKRIGCVGIDHDWQKSANGTVYNTHWADVFTRDGFRDPAGVYGPGDKFHTLPDTAVRRLVATTNGKQYRIRTADDAIRHAAAIGLRIVYGEAKPGNDWTVADFRARRRTARQAGIRLVVMTMDSWPQWRRTLWRARLAGCRTRRLHMHGRRG